MAGRAPQNLFAILADLKICIDVWHRCAFQTCVDQFHILFCCGIPVHLPGICSIHHNKSGCFLRWQLVKVIAKAATYVDFNLDIPGTVQVPCLNMNPSADAIGWRQFQPMTKIPLPFGVGGMPVMSWFQFLFGYLRITKPKHHGYIKNILPANAAWKPHA